MNCKKLLIVTSEFPPQPGGIGNHAYHLALGLEQRGYLVSVLSDIRSTNGKEEHEYDKHLPFKVYRIKRSTPIWNTYLNRIEVYRKLVKRADIVLASGKFSLWMVGLDVLLKKNKKYAVIHGSEVNLAGFQGRLTNLTLKKFKQIVAVSNYTKSLIDHLSLSNIQVIANGFHIKPIGRGNESKEKFSSYPNLITVGNVSDRKGQLNIIKALPELIKVYPKIHYHIVGIPTEKNKFSNIAKELKVEKYLTFYGKVEETEKISLLQESDIFVMLSNVTADGDVEGFGIAIIEANAIGIPAIGANTSGIVDSIQDNYSGKLIDPLEVNEFVDAVGEVLCNYENYAMNSKIWSTNFSWYKIIKQYIDVIE